MIKNKSVSENPYLSIPEVASALGMSRIALYKMVRRGEVRSIRIGRTYGIPRSFLAETKGTMNAARKKRIKVAVKRAVKDYGELLHRLGAE